MVENNGAEITTVVVGNEVFSGVGALQAACSDALVLQQRLVQGKQHLQGERDRETGRVLLLSASTNSVFSALGSRGMCHEGGEILQARPVLLFKNIM